ncbi:glycosyltransferase family 2 protein [uncultured Phenylobacterium sp.]|uniref:glycosyltransferase family 2 protein n=1 Tax=uncultured Phenylobacterium sp. TaxID=349273 RepID=UPI0025DE884E|nr:glycosyltransferase family 2 protein [uncultured Phenylobacterium sp.]
MVRLSAFVCVQNQDALLAACLRKLSFCDEVVVVADRCTDRSQEIARRHGAIVIDGIFPLESQRKAVGAEACTGDWILEVEAEDMVDAALAWEIRAVLQLRPAGDWYDLPIDNYVGETLVRDGWAGVLSARAEPRLYKRGLKTWTPRRLNAPAVIAGRFGGALKGAVRRTLARDVGALMERLGQLTALHAEDLVDAGGPASVAAGLAAGTLNFVRAYVGQGGWREGRLGFLVATLAALFPVLSQMRAGDVTAARKAAVTEAAKSSDLREVVGIAR